MMTGSDPSQESRRGVWGEHSYARGAGAPPPGSRRARTLLAPRLADPDAGPIDVDGPGEAPPEPPGPASAPPDEEDPADAEEWEASLVGEATSEARARLARSVCAALRRMRLERLVSGGGAHARDEARALAASMRRALAPLWARARDAVEWLHCALMRAPRTPRRLYEEALEELREAAPRLAERLTGARAPAPRRMREWGPALGPDAGPWLVWVSSGRAGLDARWERRLAALMHTRVLRAPAGAGAGEGDGGEGAAPPEVWCAAAAGAVRAQLTDALAEAG